MSAVSLHWRQASALGHGLPEWFEQLPEPLHMSVPLQNTPSLQKVPYGEKQVSAVSLHWLQASVLEQGEPECSQWPAPSHVSSPLQYKPSLHDIDAGTKQFSAVSLHWLLQTPPPVQGSPA